MQLIRMLLVLLAAAAAGGQFLQERYRLSVIQKLPGIEAQKRYEAQRRRGERSLLLLAIVAGLVGGVAIVDLVTGGTIGR